MATSCGWACLRKFYKYAKEGPDKERAKQMLESGNWGTTAFDKHDTLKQRLLMHYAFSLMPKKYKEYFVQR